VRDHGDLGVNKRRQQEQQYHPMDKMDPSAYANRGSVVFVGFHPDDLDFHAAGLAASLTMAGVNVIYVVVTSGEGNGRAKVREKEQRYSAALVGVDQVIFLRRKDNGLAKDYRSGYLQKLISTMIRMLRPYAIVTFCPANLTSVSFGVEHADHRYGALAVWETIYPEARREEKLPWWKFWREPLPGHQVKEVLWFGDDLVSPYSANCFLDVENVWRQVCNAQRAHKSQWQETDTLDKAAARALRTAKRWGYDGVAEEYRRIVIA